MRRSTIIPRKSDAEDHNRYKELFGEDYVESNEEDAWEPTEEFVRDEYDPSIQHQLEPSLAEYNLMVSAAKAAGIISDINTYEDAETQHRNTIRHKLSDAHFRKCTLEDQSATWDTFLSTFSHDDRFRLGLRLGIEDPLIMLLFAILPCLREIYFYAVPFEKSALTLKAPRHRFATVKKITSFSGPITYFNALLLGTSSGSIELSNTRSWKYRTHMMKDTTPLSLPPRSCNIARLAFESCDFTRQDMKTLIEACQGLKVFRSKIHGRFIEVVCDETSISFKEQLDLLFPLQIEELSLDAFTGGSILNTLPRSTSLVTLNIDSNQAFNRMRGRPGHTFWREIPSSLKHLILSACSESTSTPFDKLLPQMPDTLQQISLVVQDDHFAEVLQAKLTDKLQKPHVPYTVYTRDQFALEQVRSQPNAVAHRPPMSLYELWPDNQSVDFNPLRDAWKYHVRWNGIKYLNYL